MLRDEKRGERVEDDVWLSPNGRDRVVIRAELFGKQVENAVVVYVANIRGVEYQIVRFDMVHGFFHKDALYEGKPFKTPVFQDASTGTLWNIVREIRENFVEYRKKFVRNHLEVKK